MPGVVRLALVIVLLVTTSRKKTPKKNTEKGGDDVELGPGVVPNERDYAAAIDAEGGMGKRDETSKLKVGDRGLRAEGGKERS